MPDLLVLTLRHIIKATIPTDLGSITSRRLYLLNIAPTLQIVVSTAIIASITSITYRHRIY